MLIDTKDRLKWTAELLPAHRMSYLSPGVHNDETGPHGKVSVLMFAGSAEQHQDNDRLRALKVTPAAVNIRPSSSSWARLSARLTATT